LKAFPRLREADKFKRWMFKIIRTTFHLSLRSGKRVMEPMAPEDLASRPDSSSSGFAEVTDRGRTVQRLLAELSPEQRQALWLFEVDGFSSQEIGQVLGKNDGAVRVLLKRARDRFAQKLSQAGITP
jgi:RNA polymerase sigma-70 factor (ECF subfamily)